MDGLEFARRFRARCCTATAVMLSTVVGDEPIRQAALDSGVIDFLSSRCARASCARCRTVAASTSVRIGQAARVSLEQRLLSSMHGRERRARDADPRRAIAYREAGTSAQPRAPRRVAAIVADGMGMMEDEVRVIGLAAPLRGIGRIAIPDAIRMRPGPLTAEETLLMRKHPEIGHELLKDSQNRFIQAGATIALRHQERYDGSGYPDGLVGEQIPVEARVVAVADVFDALVSKRPYKRAWTIDETFGFISGHSGTLFDPRCVDALVRNRVRVEEACARYAPPLPAVVAAD